VNRSVQRVRPIYLNTKSDLRFRNNLKSLNDFLWNKTSQPNISEGTWPIEGIPIVKIQNTLFFIFKLNFFPNLNSLSPLGPTMLGGRSSWPADARSTQCTSSLMGSLSERGSLVHAVEATCRSDRLHLPATCRSDQKVMHEVVFVFNDTFWCQHTFW
jgi:hypothetical protein